MQCVYTSTHSVLFLGSKIAGNGTLVRRDSDAPFSLSSLLDLMSFNVDQGIFQSVQHLSLSRPIDWILKRMQFVASEVVPVSANSAQKLDVSSDIFRLAHHKERDSFTLSGSSVVNTSG